jgi:exo-1,4-beta-D-glucosaminidase
MILRTLLFAFPLLAQIRHPLPPPLRIDLAKGWSIQTSAKVSDGGDRISTDGYPTAGWYPATVPTTVVSALVNDKIYPDPDYGLNLRSIPGTTYDFGDNFAVDPMPADSPFIVPWWYRTQFNLPHTVEGRRLWLRFDSINYRADVWLNGRLLATSDQVRGMYRTFEFDITDLAAPGVNVLAVEVFAPTENDLSISFVDWNPLPPDKNMGLVRDVYILTTGPVAVRNTQVVTSLNAAFTQAQLNLYADLQNNTAQSVDGVMAATIGSVAVSKPVRLGPGEAARVSFTPSDFSQLTIANPRLWWPADLGPQNLYSLHMEFQVAGAVSGAENVQFGIRQITSELDSQQHRLFRINGQRVLIRGAAWAPDMMLRLDSQRDEYDLRYARDMHLNAIRFEGKLEMRDSFFDMADRLGILLMPGWCCCSFWEQWEKWTADDHVTAAESLRSQLRRLRNHPSVFVFLYGSDSSPTGYAEQNYLNVLQQENWPNPYLSGASDNTTAIGRTGVKMTGPYDYVPPNFWLKDTEHGGAFGFITETSPGPAIPLLASLQQMMPAADLWPIGDQTFNYHSGSGSFADVNVFSAALAGRYGAAKDLQDYVTKSQAMTYEAERAMFEAYGRNKYTSTGLIQWMMNNAWPGLIWHLYDWYLRPGGGYFGTKKACEPLHVQYSYDDQSIVVVNSLYQDFAGYQVTAEVYNFDLTQKYVRTFDFDIPADSSTRVLYLPALPDLSRTYFVRLSLNDADGNPVNRNFYWLSTQADIGDYAAWNYRYLPISTYADLTALQNLPPATVTASWQSEQNGTDEVDHVTIRNTSSALAFMVHLTVLKGQGGGDVAPVYWEDNYITLLPGEERQVSVSYPHVLLSGASSYIQVDGWNVR